MRYIVEMEARFSCKFHTISISQNYTTNDADEAKAFFTFGLAGSLGALSMKKHDNELRLLDLCTRNIYFLWEFKLKRHIF